jgi:hypothetical protein
MYSPIAPVLQNKVILFLKQDAGFDNTPVVNILFNKSGYIITYVGAATSISAFGVTPGNAYQEFVDKWELRKQRREEWQ